MCRIEEIEDYLLDLMDINLDEENAVEIRISKSKELDIFIPPIKTYSIGFETYTHPIPFGFLEEGTCIDEGQSFPLSNRYKLKETITDARNLEFYVYTVSIKCSSDYYKIIKQLDLVKRILKKVNTFSKRIGYEFMTFDEKLITTKKFFFKNSLDFSIKLVNIIDYNNLIDILEKNEYFSISLSSYPYHYLSSYYSYHHILDTSLQYNFLYNKLSKYHNRFIFINPVLSHPWKHGLY